MNGVLAWVEYHNDVKASAQTEVIALTCHSYAEAATIIENLYASDLISMKLFMLEDEVIHINDDIAQSIIKGDFI